MNRVLDLFTTIVSIIDEFGFLGFSFTNNIIRVRETFV